MYARARTCLNKAAAGVFDNNVKYIKNGGSPKPYFGLVS